MLGTAIDFGLDYDYKNLLDMQDAIWKAEEYCEEFIEKYSEYFSEDYNRKFNFNQEVFDYLAVHGDWSDVKGSIISALMNACCEYLRPSRFDASYYISTDGNDYGVVVAE
jgi:hypothetical protein